MPPLDSLIAWACWLAFIGFFGTIAIQILNGQINTKNLFYGRKRAGQLYFSPERVQLLVFTLGAAFQYISQVLQNPAKLPEIPASWLGLLGGSHAIYLAGKAYFMAGKSQKTSS